MPLGYPVGHGEYVWLYNLVLMEIGSKLKRVFSEDHRRRDKVTQSCFVLKHFRNLERQEFLSIG
jgi:hypothetical protein